MRSILRVILLLPAGLTPDDVFTTPWGRLGRYADASVVEIERIQALLRFSVGQALLGTDELICALESSDYIIGHADCLDLLPRLRLLGVKSPFAIVPDVNQVEPAQIVRLFIASQFRQPGDILFCGCPAAADAFNLFGFNCSSRYPLGIQDGFFRPMGPETRASVRYALGMTNEDFVLIFAGRLEPDKSVADLIQLLGRLRSRNSIRLIIAYHVWDDCYRERCMTLCEGRVDVTFVCLPSMDRLRDLYVAADAFITIGTSQFETFGRAVLESMACGTPAIVPRYNGFSSTVDENSGQFIAVERSDGRPRCNLQAASEAILAAASTHGWRAERSQRAIRRARRFGNSVSIRSMVCTLEGRLAGGAKSIVLPERSSIAHLDGTIRSFFSHLEGIALSELSGMPGSAPGRLLDSRSAKFIQARWFAGF